MNTPQEQQFIYQGIQAGAQANEAIGRFQLINEIYSCLREGWWAKYSPLIPISKIGQENIDKAFSKQFPWCAESFWR